MTDAELLAKAIDALVLAREACHQAGLIECDYSVIDKADEAALVVILAYEARP